MADRAWFSHSYDIRPGNASGTIFRPGHCPEILKVILKRPEIYSMSWIICRCPEIFERTCKWCISAWVHKHLYQHQGVDALMSMWTANPTVDPESWRAYLYCDTAEGTKTNSVLILLVLGNYDILDDFNGTFSACFCGFMSWKCPEILNFSCPENFLLLYPGLNILWCPELAWGKLPNKTCEGKFS